MCVKLNDYECDLKTKTIKKKKWITNLKCMKIYFMADGTSCYTLHWVTRCKVDFISCQVISLFASLKMVGKLFSFRIYYVGYRAIVAAAAMFTLFPIIKTMPVHYSRTKYRSIMVESVLFSWKYFQQCHLFRGSIWETYAEKASCWAFPPLLPHIHNVGFAEYRK